MDRKKEKKKKKTISYGLVPGPINASLRYNDIKRTDEQSRNFSEILPQYFSE